MAAAAEGVPGFLGLHLEGPHLDLRRKGAHDPALIRPMEAGDLAVLVDAAARLPALMVTVAPEAVTLQQIAAARRRRGDRQPRAFRHRRGGGAGGVRGRGAAR